MPNDDSQGRGPQLLIKIARERLKLNPTDPKALFALAAAQGTLGDLHSGVRTLERLAVIEPNYPGLWVLKSKLHARLGETEKARRSRLRAQQLEPEAAKVARSPFPCPICEVPVPADASICENCGAKFEPDKSVEDELEDLSRVAVQKMVEGTFDVPARSEQSRPKGALKSVPGSTAAQGLTNGLALRSRRQRRIANTDGLQGRTNGLRGRTNGLGGPTNGLANGLRGRTNGLTNGLGRTNGLTNGSGGATQSGAFPPAGRRRMGRSTGWKLYLIPLVCVALLFVALYLVPAYMGPSYPIQIDGQFADWNGVARLGVSSAAANPDIDITQVAVKDNLDYLAFYIEVRGAALNAGPAPARVTNAFFAFIDVDRSSLTGYRVQGIGADRMVSIHTWGGQVVSAVLMAFNTSRGPSDWNGWMSVGPVFAAGSGNQIEFETPWRDLAQTPGILNVAFASRSWDAQSDAADTVVTNAEPFVVMSQATNAPLLASGNGTTLAQIALRAVGGAVIVHGINVTFTGTFLPSSISAVDLTEPSLGVLATHPISPFVHFTFAPIALADGVARTFAVTPHVSSSAGTTVGAFVRDVEDIEVSGAGVAVVRPETGPASLAYIGAVPSGPRVDGAFAEWTNVTADPVGDVRPTWDRDVDLSAYAYKSSGGNLYFTARVAGTILNGTLIPALNPAYVPPSNSSGGGVVAPPPPPVNGTDSLRFFLDADGNSSTGYAIGGIGADNMVEIIGKDGLVLSSRGFRFAGSHPSDWSWAFVGMVDAAKNAVQLEASFPGIAIATNSRGYFELSGWNGAGDSSKSPTGANPFDPVVISPTGASKYSPGTSAWSNLPSLPSAPPGPQTTGWSDAITTVPLNDTYAISTGSTVYKLASGSSAWTLFLSPPTSGAPITDVISIATDDQNTFYAITKGDSASGDDNQVYSYTGASPGTWPAPATLAATNVVDMEYVSGNGGSATLYLLQSTVNTQLMGSTSGGQAWTPFGAALPASPGGTLANAGFDVYPSTTINVLLNNGTLERSTNGATSWTWIPKSLSSPSGNVWVDVAGDTSNNIWTVAALGSPATYVAVWQYSTSTNTWTNMTGTISMSNAVGISVPIPEFEHLAVAALVAVAIPILVRLRRKRRSPASTPPPCSHVAMVRIFANLDLPVSSEYPSRKRS